MVRVAIYTRVSTEEQTENYSLETQASILADFTDSQNLTIVRQYVDAGYSGTKLDRPALKELLVDAKDGLFETVLIYRLDRLARSTRLAYTIIEQLMDSGVGVRSYSEPQIDSTTPMGKVSLGVTAIFAELERDTFIQRSKDGIRKAAESGHYVGGIVAYGYHVVNKKLAIHEEEAEVIRMIFAWTEKGWTTVRIADELTLLNIPPRYRRDGRGVRGVATVNWWRPGAVQRILKNATYKGEYHYGKANAKKASGKGSGVVVYPCPAIVSEEQWEIAQQTLQRNKLMSLRNAKKIYMLKSLIKCNSCGATYCGSGTKKWNGYRCLGRSTRSGRTKTYDGEKCDSPNIRAAELESEVWRYICEVLLDPENHIQQKRSDDETPPELPHVESGIASAKRAKSRLTDLYIDGLIEKAEYRERSAALDTQIADLKARFLELNDTMARRLAAEKENNLIRNLSATYCDALETADDSLRQTLAHLFVEKIVIQSDGSADIFWKI